MFLLSKLSTLILGTTRLPKQWVQGPIVRGEANEARCITLPHSAETKSEWSYTSPLPDGWYCPRYDAKQGQFCLLQCL
jgi:hypothetical protein